MIDLRCVEERYGTSKLLVVVFCVVVVPKPDDLIVEDVLDEYLDE